MRAKNLLDVIRVILGCKWVERTEISPTVVMFGDEEALLKFNWHFKFKLAAQPVGGRVLLLGVDHDDEDLGCKELESPPLEFVQEHVVWLGTDDSLERNIQLNEAIRPQTTITATDKDGNPVSEKVWEWSPHKKEEADEESTQHKGNGHNPSQGDSVG